MAYYCPMHAAQGMRFGLLRHMLGSPRHIAIMLAAMLALMAAAMMLIH